MSEIVPLRSIYPLWREIAHIADGLGVPCPVTQAQIAGSQCAEHMRQVGPLLADLAVACDWAQAYGMPSEAPDEHGVIDECRDESGVWYRISCRDGTIRAIPIGYRSLASWLFAL